MGRDGNVNHVSSVLQPTRCRYRHRPRRGKTVDDVWRAYQIRRLAMCRRFLFPVKDERQVDRLYGAHLLSWRAYHQTSSVLRLRYRRSQRAQSADREARVSKREAQSFDRRLYETRRCWSQLVKHDEPCQWALTAVRLRYRLFYVPIGVMRSWW